MSQMLLLTCLLTLSPSACDDPAPAWDGPAPAWDGPAPDWDSPAPLGDPANNSSC